MKWEYKELPAVAVDHLDMLGADGWELVSALAFPSQAMPGTTAFRYIFKRPLK